MADQSKIQYYTRRLGQLDTERESFITHWKDLSDFIQPRRGRFFVQDRNKGTRKHNNIINSAGGQALRIAQSGMLAGTMSPSRPWFDLETNDPDMMEFQPVKEWISDVVRILRSIFNSSNLYGQSSVMLSELLLFGTGCMLHVNDFNDVARFYTQTVGTYYLAQNERLEVDTLVRKFEWTINQIVREYGLENVSTFVKTAYDRGNYDLWAPVVHFIEPNIQSTARPEVAIDKPFASVTFEPGNSGSDSNKFLRQSGFDVFPAYCPRWGTTGDDIYGTDCPGMISLGDVRSLQQEEKEKAKAIEKMVSPPMSGPPGLMDVPVNNLPGGLTIYSATGTQKLEPIYQNIAPIQELRLDMDSIENRINQAFFVDLFLAISNIQGIQPRNELDILSRNEERLLQLGPVLERLHGEFLELMIDRTFNQAMDAGILPEPPPQLQGQDLKIKFISNLAVAQRAVVTADLDRILQATVGIVQVDPSAAIKLDGQQFIDEYAKAIGVPPKVIRPDDNVAEILAAQKAEADQLRAQETMLATAQTAQTMAGAKTDEKNLLTDLAGSQNEQ